MATAGASSTVYVQYGNKFAGGDERAEYPANSKAAKCTGSNGAVSPFVVKMVHVAYSIVLI